MSTQTLPTTVTGTKDKSVSKQFRWILSALGGLAAGGIWGVCCAAFGWSLWGLAGLIVGLLVGVTQSMLQGGEPASAIGSAISAATVTTLVLWVGQGGVERRKHEQLQLTTESEESLIATMAEEIALENFTSEKTAAESRAAARESTATPFAAAREAISPALWQQATERWNALSTEEQQAIRKQRQRWLQLSHGPALQQYDTGPSWLQQASVTLSASALSFAIALLAPRLLNGTH